MEPASRALPISLESGNGNCDMVEKSVSLDILSDNMYRLSFADHSKVSNSLFYLKRTKIKSINSLIAFINYYN